MNSIQIKNLARTALLLALAIIIQFLGRNLPAINQFMVGPLINAILLITTFVCGTIWGISIGILTPILAWAVGQLPSPMAPFIPFIIIGNIIFVLAFGLLKSKSYGKYLGILIGSILKFAFLSLSARKLVALFKLAIPSKVANKLIIMMGIPQLITALIGGILALVVIYILINRKVIEV
ncbi:ECF transporter S component [Clostridium oryzae]|uniref:ECF transporter S component n=1 Tax=Clostridium oryzae TaxID=1450648 RepID=A0A1V4II40_9CLOT|nr:ECF transporter S component [Clostridium oryzae]OPJ59345.1 hypothetical protein CLORY_33540 [Clostridium oryzae]